MLNLIKNICVFVHITLLVPSKTLGLPPPPSPRGVDGIKGHQGLGPNVLVKDVEAAPFFALDSTSTAIITTHSFYKTNVDKKWKEYFQDKNLYFYTLKWLLKLKYVNSSTIKAAEKKPFAINKENKGKW